MFFLQVGMDKALNQLSVPLGQLREEVLVCAHLYSFPNLLWISALSFLILSISFRRV